MEMFLAGFALCLSACMDLGVVNVATIKRGLDGGWRAALALSFGSCFGDLTYAILGLFGLALVLAEPHVRVAYWLGGTVVLGYLAISMIRETWHPRTPAITADDPDGQSGGTSSRGTSAPRDFLRGLALALSSPSMIIWFASAGGAVMAGIYRRAGGPPYLFLAGFFCCSLTWSIALSLLSGKGRHVLGPRALRTFSGASAAIFAILAVKVFLDGLPAAA
jgi:L-lysine exporter family protein LysE/ArgO